MVHSNSDSTESGPQNNAGISRRSVLRATAGAVAVGGLAGVASGAEPEEYNVGIAPGASGAEGTVRGKADSVRKTIDLGPQGKTVVGKFSENALDGLRNNPNVSYVEPNYTAYKLAEKLPVGIDRVDADVLHSNGDTGSGATVAVIDTGVDDQQRERLLRVR